MMNTLKPLILVNASLALTFALFYALANLCVTFNFPQWLSVPALMAVCGGIYWKTVWGSARRWL